MVLSNFKIIHIFFTFTLSFFSLFLIWGCGHNNNSESESLFNYGLSFEEVLVPIPDGMTNDWNFISESYTNNERVVSIYDPFNKSFYNYSLDKKILVGQTMPFSDTLNPLMVLPFIKTDDGFLANTDKGILLLTDNGTLLKRWDHPFKLRNPIPNFKYGRKVIYTSSHFKISNFSPTKIAINLRLPNSHHEGVFNSASYEFPIFGELNLLTGHLKEYPLFFPIDFLKDGKSYPEHFDPKFTAFKKKYLAYMFGIDDKIYLYDLDNGKTTTHVVSNPKFPINVPSIEIDFFKNKAAFSAYKSTLNHYFALFYDYQNNVLLRYYAGQVDGGDRRRFVEILNDKLEIVSYFEVDSKYMVTPLFFPNEIWFPYFSGFKSDTMNFFKVVLEKELD